MSANAVAKAQAKELESVEGKPPWHCLPSGCWLLAAVTDTDAVVVVIVVVAWMVGCSAISALVPHGYDLWHWWWLVACSCDKYTKREKARLSHIHAHRKIPRDVYHKDKQAASQPARWTDVSSYRHYNYKSCCCCCCLASKTLKLLTTTTFKLKVCKALTMTFSSLSTPTKPPSAPPPPPQSPLHQPCVPHPHLCALAVCSSEQWIVSCECNCDTCYKFNGLSFYDSLPGNHIQGYFFN